jgi:hypothetical protein
MQSVEAILSKSKTKRRHRKSHGRISFGDLARTIADNWKSVSPKTKTIFDHYAERDMLRYKREVKVWKDRKDLEDEQTTLAKQSMFVNSMSSSLASESSTSEYPERYPEGGSGHLSGSWNRPGRYSSSFGGQQTDVTSFNSSISSLDSHIPHFAASDSESMQQMLMRQQQILQQQFMFDNSTSMVSQSSSHTRTSGPGGGMMMTPGSSSLHASFSNFPAIVPSSGAAGSGSMYGMSSGRVAGTMAAPGSLVSGSMHGFPLRPQQQLQQRLQQEQLMMVSNNSTVNSSIGNVGQDSFRAGGFLQQDAPRRGFSTVAPSIMPSQEQQQQLQHLMHQQQIQQIQMQQQQQSFQQPLSQIPVQQAFGGGIGHASTTSLQVSDDPLLGPTSHSVPDHSAVTQQQNSISMYGPASISRGLGFGELGSTSTSNGIVTGGFHGSSLHFNMMHQQQQQSPFQQLHQPQQYHPHRTNEQMATFGLGRSGASTIDEHHHDASMHLSPMGGFMGGGDGYGR